MAVDNVPTPIITHQTQVDDENAIVNNKHQDVLDKSPEQIYQLSVDSKRPSFTIQDNLCDHIQKNEG
jgi:hypothetical protein